MPDGISISELGITPEDIKDTPKTISGNELPANWPQMLTQEQESSVYQKMYHEGEDRNLPPPRSQIEGLSYELVRDNKRLRYFAVSHSPSPEEINYKQYEILEKKFNDSPPQLVLIEGFIESDVKLNREDALKYGEQYFMSYLVQQHNANLKEGENPIYIESADIPEDQLVTEIKKGGRTDEEIQTYLRNRGKSQQDPMYAEERMIRDKFIVENIAGNVRKHDRVDVVFGSGHPIRQKPALEQYFEAPARGLIHN